MVAMPLKLATPHDVSTWSSGSQPTTIVELIVDASVPDVVGKIVELIQIPSRASRSARRKYRR